MTRRRTRLLAVSMVGALTLAPALLVATPAAAATIPVGSESDLVAAILTANADAEPDVIQFTGDISLSAALPHIVQPLTIDGAGHELAANGWDAIYADTSTLTVQNLTIREPFTGISSYGGA